MAGKVNIVRLADNIATTIRAKYCDVFVGEHGPDLRFKGAIEGGDANSAIYVNFAHGLDQLRAIGAVDDKVYREATDAVQKDEIPETGFAVGLKKKTLTILREKPAGAKHGTLRITVPGEASPTQPMPASETSASADAASNGQQPREKRTGIYLTATSFVLDKVVPLYKEKGITLSGTDIKEMVNTIYIGETRNGH